MLRLRETLHLQGGGEYMFRDEHGYMDVTAGGAGATLAMTGTSLAVGWYAMAAVTLLFLGIALLQLVRRPTEERP